MIILLLIFLEIMLFILMGAFYVIGDNSCNDGIVTICIIMLGVCLIGAAVSPFAIGALHGYVNYAESNDRDKARITAVTMEQTPFRKYYKVEVEYLTNTPTQSGVVTNYNIEKDTFYCYYEDKELVEKLKENQYKELWIISGYKGGYETFKDFGTKLIKDVELIEE